MLYLLDANVLINAQRDYYPIRRVPEFWDWLLHHGTAGRVKIPSEILDEVKRGTRPQGEDDLLDWLRDIDARSSLVLAEEPDPDLVRRVVEQGYAPNLRDDEIEKLGRDPFLIAYAIEDPGGRCIVTTEVSKPSKKRANRKIPDVARGFGVQSYDTFQFTRMLDFSTTWQK